MEKEIYRRPPGGTHPPNLSPEYKSTSGRAPRQAPIALPHTLSEVTGPLLATERVDAIENDLTRQRLGEPLGERIVVHGRVLDENGRPVPNALVEVWQANAGGRYLHKKDQYIAPIDPNFGGCGRMLTDADGHYHFRTIKPGPYPWRNQINDWRPAHIHYSISGPAFCQRLITQMYFAGDPLIERCPIARSIPDEASIRALIAGLDHHAFQPLDSLAYRFDIVIRGARATWFENGGAK